MEHRGVVVAIAGRRDGVRVYALEEIRRMVEWRMDVEIRRERERARREETRQRPLTAIALAHHDEPEKRGSIDKQPAIVHTVANDKKPAGPRRGSVSVGQPRPPVVRTPKPRAASVRSTLPEPLGPPPAYSSTPPQDRERERERERERDQVTPTRPRARSRATSVSEVLAGTVSRRHTMTNVNGETQPQEDAKGDWASSDDEAINVVAAPSGSQLLDERTSAMAAASTSAASRIEMGRAHTAPSLSARPNRRSRPANLDLSLSRSNTSNVVPVPPPSPTPTLLTLRQALSMNGIARDEDGAMSPELDGDADGEEEEDGEPTPSSPTTPTRERISLAEALFESRLPELPPAGTRRDQEPIIINPQNPVDDVPASPRTSESHSTFTRASTGDQSNRRRRRWSVLGGVFNSSGQSQSSIPSLSELTQAAVSPPAPSPPNPPEMRERRPTVLTRSHSGRVSASASNATVTPARTQRRPSTSPGPSTAPATQASMDVPLPPLPQPPSASSTSRFLPRLLHNALGRRSDDAPPLPRTAGAGYEKAANMPPPPHAPAPKLEYVKLPGTKGAVAVKAVETAKKRCASIYMFSHSSCGS